MSLNSSTFMDSVIPGLLMEDFRNQTPLLSILMDSPTSRDVLAKLVAAGGPGGFAKSITIPMLEQHALNPSDAYGVETNFPSGSTVNPDLSSAYPESTDTPIVFKCDKVVVGTHYAPDMRLWTHSTGAGVLIPAEVRANLAQMKDIMEKEVISKMMFQSGGETVSGGLAIKFAFDTSAEANLLTDLAQLAAEFNRQNIPANDRWIILPASKEPIVIKYTALKSLDWVDPADASQSDAKWARIAGFNLIYSNNLTATQGIAFSTSRFAFVMPKGIVTETLRDKDRIGTYTRMYGMFGSGSISEDLATAPDGNTPTLNYMKVGIEGLVVA